MKTSLNNNWVCIDFGTCNTAAAIQIDGKPHVVTYGNTQFFPTIACVLPNKDIQVCQNAEPLRLKLPESFKQEFKLNIAEQIDLNPLLFIGTALFVQLLIILCVVLKAWYIANENPVKSIKTE